LLPETRICAAMEVLTVLFSDFEIHEIALAVALRLQGALWYNRIEFGNLD
jgi:hypothetical protein